MDALAEIIGISAAQLTQLLILAVVLLVALFVLRGVMRLTAALFRLGCLGIGLIVLAVFVMQWLSN